MKTISPGLYVFETGHLISKGAGNPLAYNQDRHLIKCGFYTVNTVC